jgi:2,4-dienoyl-CoA reductase-like NADH-dependent reductase (Old Yellow Enzyme family)
VTTLNSDQQQADSRLTGETQRRVLKRDRNPHLFRPIEFRSVKVRNRIVLSPMCQYSATDGMPNNWHLVHLGARASGGAGIVFTEAVHTEARGRITSHCLGLWNNEQRDALAPIAKFIEEQGAVPAIQLGHAGRKASVGRPWEGTEPVSVEEGGWPVISPSNKPYAKGWPVPQAMCKSEIELSLEKLAAATKRAVEAGFKILELHGAHGYLIHQFLSPLSNFRHDEYGGCFENRVRYLFDSIKVVREHWPQEYPLFLRLSVTDWVEGGWSEEDSIKLARMLKASGDVDLIDCSSGGNDPRQKIPIHPAYQVPFAQSLRQESGIATAAVGLINSPDLAESIVANKQADLIILGRTLLADPVWPLRAANTLKTDLAVWPTQYERSNIF